ncbi:MAG: metal ABC transporter substrate-binding protein [Propionivibrio sp.]|nr:metal ABC transporter substrate-binding protein [Propionivibrio sp.]MBK8746247.1 metal ABC transporter substrate-binding protein [Propionivibrio sp.]MBL0208406.1 metal ABC transporter substrate-binding protein [Propionivibrio sp.]
MESLMQTLLRRLVFASLLIVVGIAGNAAAEPLKVVATFSILGDMTQRIGGERIELHTLVGLNADAHVYQPTPADAKMIAQARLVIVNGYGFEGWIERLIKSSGYRGKVLTASAGVKTLARPHSPDEMQNPNTHDGAVDPHAWQDLSNALRYVDNIVRALSEADPAGQQFFQANAAKYQHEISALDSEIRMSFNAIPSGQRRVVTSHDAFGYFSRAYGIAFISPVGINTDAEPSAADVGRIIRQIRREHIRAVFMESVSDPRLLERIRLESGARIGGTLYSDALSKPDGPAATYLDLMRHNARTLAAALAE